MLRRIGILFAAVALGHGATSETFIEKMRRDWAIINYDESQFKTAGSKISLGFIDSAFDLNHRSLKNKIAELRGSNAISQTIQKALDAMHGTHVSAIALGNYFSDALPHGIVPNAKLFGISNLNPDSPNQVGFDEIISFFKGNGVKIVNNSWGLTYFPNSNKRIDDKTAFTYAYLDFTSTPQEVLKIANDDADLKATMELAKSGILQVYSSGNEGQRSPMINASMPSYDSSLKAWLNVGAIDTDYFTKNNSSFDITKADEVTRSDGEVFVRSAFTSFSNSFKFAQAYSMLAPGYNIISANAYFNKMDINSINCPKELEFCALSGTSQAAPFVSGAAALVAEKYLFADGRLLADILLSTANSNINNLPKIIIKQSHKKWFDGNSQRYYYDIIYTDENYSTNEKIKDYLKTTMSLSDDEIANIFNHLMNEPVYMSKDELIGQGILDITKALNGLAVLDANRMDNNDIQKRDGGEQAIYVIDTKGFNGEFKNDIKQKNWESAWHLDTLTNVDKVKSPNLKIGLEKKGNGILVLSGTNSYLGDTIASGGTLKLTGILENSSVFAQNGGTFNLAGNVKNNVTALNNGRILLSNAATIGKSLNSQNSGIIEIQNGASVNVPMTNNAGILKGVGTINGNVENDGIVMSGFYDEIKDINHGDKLNILGDFSQSSPSAKLQIAFLKDGTNTDFSATNYTITGGILEYIPLQNSTNYIKPDDKIKIAINQNLTNELDKFTNIQVKSTNILEFQVDSKDKTLLNAKVKANAFDNANTELSNVLKEMLGRNISPQYDAAFAAIGQMSPAQYQSTMDSIAATPTKQSLHTIDSTQKTLGLKNTLFMIDPFDNIGDLNPSSVVFEPTAALGDAHLQNISDVYVKTKLSAGITYKKMKHDDYDQTSYLFDIQGKKEIDESSKLGGFIGLAHSKTENDDSKLKSNLFSLGASYERDFGAFSALSGLSAGMSFNNLDQSIRNLANSDTSAKYKNYFLTAQAGIYKGIALSQNTQIAPLAMLEYNFIHQESFSQNGGVFAREFDAKNSSFARLWAGANFSHKWMLNDFEMTGSLYAFYWHRFDSKQSEDLSFSAARDLKFSNHFSAEQNGFYGGVSLQARRKNVFFKASFSDEKASAYNQYEIMLRAGMNF